MRKYGKYEKRPEGVPVKQPKVKSALLQTYFTSLICLVLCVGMFFGTSYAWFTSEVNNEGNEIYIGTLDVELEKKNGDAWASLSTTEGGVNTTKLFDSSIRWEPGYTALETVKITNKGDLAFRYELTFTDGKATGEISKTLEEVAQWFDVWCYHNFENTIPAPENYKQITEENGWKKVGSLVDVLAGKAVFYGNMTKEDVADKAETAHTYTIALHMNGEKAEEGQQETLNALMGQKVSLNVKLVATQLSSEQDAFGATYDLEAFANTLAQVNDLAEKNITFTWGMNGGTGEKMELDTAYQFLPNDSLEEAEVSPYRYYHADFVVKADKDVPVKSVALAGYYKLWCKDWNNDNWVALYSDTEIKAGEEIRLVCAMGNGSISVNYEELCRYGNDGIGFLCGAAELTNSDGEGMLSPGTTLTVELRLYETEAPSAANGNSTNVETGRYITVGSYDYTFE